MRSFVTRWSERNSGNVRSVRDTRQLPASWAQLDYFISLLLHGGQILVWLRQSAQDGPPWYLQLRPMIIQFGHPSVYPEKDIPA